MPLTSSYSSWPRHGESSSSDDPLGTLLAFLVCAGILFIGLSAAHWWELRGKQPVKIRGWKQTRLNPEAYQKF